MNIRIIDPGKSVSFKPRQWGQGRDDEDLADLDELHPNVSDDRLELLVELRVLQCHLLTEGASRHLVPEALRAFWGERVDSLRSSVGNLEKIAGNLGLTLSPTREVDLETGFAGLAGKPGGDPLATTSGLIGAALLFNALGLAVASAFLREEDRTVLKRGLLPILSEDSRFEGRMSGYFDFQGNATAVHADEWLSLAASVGSGSPARVWSFDLLRMGIRRLLGRGFFPVE